MQKLSEKTSPGAVGHKYSMQCCIVGVYEEFVVNHIRFKESKCLYAFFKTTGCSFDKSFDPHHPHHCFIVVGHRILVVVSFLFRLLFDRFHHFGKVICKCDFRDRHGDCRFSGSNHIEMCFVEIDFKNYEQIALHSRILIGRKNN